MRKIIKPDVLKLLINLFCSRKPARPSSARPAPPRKKKQETPEEPQRLVNLA